jgi:hypothetical protein
MSRRERENVAALLPDSSGRPPLDGWCLPVTVDGKMVAIRGRCGAVRCLISEAGVQPFPEAAEYLCAPGESSVSRAPAP